MKDSKESLMGEQYKNPPVNEVICSVTFLPDDAHPWSAVQIGQTYELLKDAYPDVGQRKVVRNEISARDGVISIKEENVTRFVNKDKPQIIEQQINCYGGHQENHYHKYPTSQDFSKKNQ